MTKTDTIWRGGQGKLYPYTIPSIKCPPDHVLKKIDPWQMLEFFRVEALLRSESVHRLYQPVANSALERSQLDFVLFDPYGLTWGILEGDHHCLLRPDPAPFRPPWVPLPANQSEMLTRAGITDIGASCREGHSDFWNLAMNASADSEHVYLAIDVGFPTETILKALRTMLRAQQKKVFELRQRGMAEPESLPIVPGCFTEFAIPHGPRKALPPIQNPKAWLKYFRCYDLRHCEGRSFGAIGQLVYGASAKKTIQGRKSRETAAKEAKRACKKVQYLIDAAEHGPWPPKEL